jgi:hypothetical protein
MCTRIIRDDVDLGIKETYEYRMPVLQGYTMRRDHITVGNQTTIGSHSYCITGYSSMQILLQRNKAFT